ncbi:MAG TPA: IS6 family transposase [Candidatus Competibacteraceae bacterium]|nr:IS6 family transposase [Candidatus Competibacteraceae bacterium]
MDCPHCHSAQTIRLPRTTGLGYAVFGCTDCGRTSNERTGTPFNYLEVPTDIVFQVLFCRLRYKLSYRDVAELFLLRGFDFTHETVRDWEERFTPILADRLRAKRRGKAGKVWHVDETYIKIKGRWCYLYRAIDQKGNLVDSRLSEQRDMAAAKAFFTQAKNRAGTPERVITDGHTPYPRAIAEVLGAKVVHSQVGCRANPIEQDHRGIKHRYYPMLGFGNFTAAQRFCRDFEEVRQFLRPRQCMGQFISLAQRRAHVLKRVEELHSLFAPA